MKTIRILIMFLLLFCAFGCGGDSEPADEGIPTGAPDITGIITSLFASSIRVEEDPAAEWGSSKADVRLTDSTRVLDRDGTPLSAVQLAVGQTVQAWFTGPVAESYPLQATASAVVILDLAPAAP